MLTIIIYDDLSLIELFEYCFVGITQKELTLMIMITDGVDVYDGKKKHSVWNSSI